MIIRNHSSFEVYAISVRYILDTLYSLIIRSHIVFHQLKT